MLILVFILFLPVLVLALCSLFGGVAPMTPEERTKWTAYEQEMKQLRAAREKAKRSPRRAPERARARTVEVLLQHDLDKAPPVTLF
ncbi:hypothetical protein [Deinococcus hohokamensis]|uniref:Uncharacterized protein n=1 Tax=Deinococcus hohokamensis TaxID=309883 RepID=A0ABV9I4R7_9DEIO